MASCTDAFPDHRVSKQPRTSSWGPTANRVKLYGGLFDPFSKIRQDNKFRIKCVLAVKGYNSPRAELIERVELQQGLVESNPCVLTWQEEVVVLGFEMTGQSDEEMTDALLELGPSEDDSEDDTVRWQLAQGFLEDFDRAGGYLAPTSNACTVAHRQCI
jgi:hypothetical protein